MIGSQNQIEIWVVELNPSHKAQPSEIVYSTTPEQLVHQVAGGLRIDGFMTFGTKLDAVNAACEMLADMNARMLNRMNDFSMLAERLKDEMAKQAARR